MTREAAPEWSVLIEPFQSLFSKPGFRYFCAFVRVFAHLDGRLWVTQTVLSGLLARHWTNFTLFLWSPAWDTAAVARQLFAFCQPVCRDAAERVFVALDGTVCRKTGKHFDSLGLHYDPMNKQHPRHLSHGHCFVALAMLAYQTGQKSRRAVCFLRSVCPQECVLQGTTLSKQTPTRRSLDCGVAARQNAGRRRRWRVCQSRICSRDCGKRAVSALKAASGCRFL